MRKGDHLTLLRGVFSSMFLRLDEISTQVEAGVQTAHTLQDDQRRIEETIEYFAADITSRNGNTPVLVNGIEADGGGSVSGILPAGEDEPGRGNVPADTQIDRKEPNPSSQETALIITATVGHYNCARCCPCQCHAPFSLQAPYFLRDLLGSWMLVLKNIALPTTRRCDYSLCRKSRLSSFSVSYYFPRWMLARAITIMGNWKDLHGGGVSIVVRMPRVRPFDTPLFRLTESANVDAFKSLLSTREVSPFDVTPDGKSCLWVCTSRNLPVLSHKLSNLC
jgi:hypothetical protein